MPFLRSELQIAAVCGLWSLPPSRSAPPRVPPAPCPPSGQQHSSDRSLRLLLHLKAACPELCPPTCCLFFPTSLSPTSPSLSMSNPHLDWKLSPTQQASALELQVSLQGCQPGTQGTHCLGFNSRQHHGAAEHPSRELDVGLSSSGLPSSPGSGLNLCPRSSETPAGKRGRGSTVTTADLCLTRNGVLPG